MLIQMLDSFSKGTLLGLAAGFSPGPLTVLVISETLRHGLGAGVRVSLAPVLTDLPIIVLAVLLLDRLSAYPAAWGAIALTGGAFLLYLGLSSLRVSRLTLKPDPPAPRSLAKGIAANFLNPNPYVFWTGVGTPILLNAFERSWMQAAAFACAFFFFIVGSKVLLARLVDRSRTFLDSHLYLWIMRILGLLLIIFALMFFRDGLIRIGVWSL